MVCQTNQEVMKVINVFKLVGRNLPRKKHDSIVSDVNRPRNYSRLP